MLALPAYRVLLTAAAIGLVLPATLAGDSGADAPDHVPGRLLVKMSPDAAAPARVDAEAGRVPRWLATHGAEGLRPLDDGRPGRLAALARRVGLDRTFVVEFRTPADMPATGELLERLETERVVHAHPDWIGTGGMKVIPADTSWSVQWDKDNTGQSNGTPDADLDAAEAWLTATGRREIVVAVLDSGIDGDHTAFRGRIGRGGRDEVNTDFDPEDDHGHGTSVTGLIGANANDRFSVAGVDWRSTFLPVKVLNASNSGSTTDLVDGIRYAADHGADVSNMSLIRYPGSNSLQDAVTYADDAGVIQIGCNGNDGNAVLNYPASFVEVLSTGWTTDDDLRANSSSFTTTLDVMAPGSGTRTVLYNSGADSWASFSGCSAATPHVTGITSVMLALDPTLTYPQVRDVLRATADDEVGLPSEDVPGRDDFYGWGRVSMEQAFAALGIVSRDEMHVDGITLEEVSPTKLEVRVMVLDELTGAEEGVLVDGTLTRPDSTTVPLSATTASNGEAVMTYQPGGAIPNGAFTFDVTSLVKPGFIYDDAANFEASRTHDPNLDGIHIAALEISDDFDTLLVEVLVVDDDGVPAGGVTVDLDLDVPTGPNQALSQVATWAAGGWARFEYTSGGGASPGLYTATVTGLTQSGFVYETAKNVVSSRQHTLLAENDDEDGDGDQNRNDNCITTANADQADLDGDGFGDACDTCVSRVDPAQRDTDGDGTGNRCDCAPFDASSADVGEVWGVRIDATGQGLSWNGVVGADHYDVSRGLVSGLDGSDYGACLADDSQGTALPVPGAPPAGDAYFYLVRGDDTICGAGALGTAPTGVRVNANPAACGP